MFKPTPELKDYKLGNDDNFIDALAKILSSIKLSEPNVSVITETQIADLGEQFAKSTLDPQVNRIRQGLKVTRTPILKNYYPRPTPVELQFEDNDMGEKVQYDGRSIVEWNIDGQTEYHVVNTMRHMMMISSASKLQGYSDRAIAHVLVARFIGQLRGWWDFLLGEEAKGQILNAT
ncbi:hypothetical protein ACFX13_030741 [Malus domestica]